MVINYCLRNVSPETRALLRHSHFKVIEDFCLHRCGNCYDGPFLVVEGHLVTGDSHQMILEKLGRKLERSA